jgi:hypothetical protein
MLMEQMLQTVAPPSRLQMFRQRSSAAHPHYTPCYPLPAQNLQLSTHRRFATQPPNGCAMRHPFFNAPLTLCSLV